MTSKMTEWELKYVQGVEGNSIYLNDFRIAGPKPWGGGKVLRQWKVTLADLERAIPGLTYQKGLEDGKRG